MIETCLVLFATGCIAGVGLWMFTYNIVGLLLVVISLGISFSQTGELGKESHRLLIAAATYVIGVAAALTTCKILSRRTSKDK